MMVLFVRPKSIGGDEKKGSADKGTFLREDFFFTTRFFKVAGIFDRSFLAVVFIKVPCYKFAVDYVRLSFILFRPARFVHEIR